jgi:hypothetical protein
MKRQFLFMVIISLSSFLAGCSAPLLYRAAGDGDIVTVKKILDKGGDANQKGGGGLLNDSNALTIASTQGHIEIVKLLLDRGANVNAAHGNMGWTPLSSAAWTGQTDVAKLLVDRGADINKAIRALGNGVGTRDAIELLKEIKQEKAFSQPAAVKPSAEKSPASEMVRSDVDDLPPAKIKENKNAYAVVIGVENYRQELPKASFAVHDAQTIAGYLVKVLGYPEQNVILLLNDHASNVDLVKYFEKWLPNNVEPGSSVFVYYSGHGAPNPKTGDAYLVPYDGDPSFLDETGYSLKRMYAALGKLPATGIVVALDSCFSGAGGRSVLAEGARPLVMNLQKTVVLTKNMTVLSASSGVQISSTYKEKGHGLFTYFLLKGIKDEDTVRQDGSLNVGDLYGYLKPQVERIARKQYNNEQTPQLIQAQDQGK